MRNLFSRSAWWIAALAVLLAFAGLGSRGIWDPDEGRYSNVALQMLDSGDWINPHRSHDTGHWTKPPLTYWAIGGSVAVFGQNPWAVRLPSALSYLFCVWLAWHCARRLLPGSETSAALAYMTMLMPQIAGQLVTTDFILTAMQTLAVVAFIEWRFGPPSAAMRAWWLMWVAFAAAFLTKGPPALLPMLVMLAFVTLVPGKRAQDWRHVLAGVAVMLLLALPWFIAVTVENTGLLDYFLGAEVVDRIASDRFKRHGEWYGWAEIYLPTLLIGALPWTGHLISWSRQLPSAVRRWRDKSLREIEAPRLFIVLWLLIPLLVFCLARSRLPLYLLPLFVPIALVIAAERLRKGLPELDGRWVLGWVALLIGLRFAIALYPSDRDASQWADAIRERAADKVGEVVFVEDMPRYGLHLYLDVDIEALSLDDIAQPAFNPEFDESLAVELAESAVEKDVVFVAKARLWPRLRQRIVEQGYRALPLGAPYHGRIIFEVERATPSP